MSQIVSQRIVEWTIDPPPPMYEIKRGGLMIIVSLYVFRSWSGQRFLNGTEFHGPVYYLGTDEVAKTT